ncbi:MAG: 3-oxoacyl-[acyl-carrier-protein] reductase [Nitrospinae bacterium]|nr:3-oxoacyl-[acyl-carrier-protein] reductase [Nitrospinota bacterium]
MKLEGRVAIVTGGGRGIGRHIALILAEEGADMVISDIDPEGISETAEGIRSLGRRALPIKSDVSLVDDVNNMVDRCISELEKVDILINNAGITRDSLIVRMKEEDWDMVLRVNLTGTFNCMKAVTKYMMKQRRGKIVNIASIVGVMGNAGQANYSASKAGIIGLTKSIAKELAPRGINVNAIAPGFIDTDMTISLPEKIREGLLRQIPMGRFGVSKDIANCTKFLVSEDSDYITGQVIHVNGGMWM